MVTKQDAAVGYDLQIDLLEIDPSASDAIEGELGPQ